MFGPEYVRFPCLKYEHKGLDTPALQETYYCKVCRDNRGDNRQVRIYLSSDFNQYKHCHLAKTIGMFALMSSK